MLDHADLADKKKFGFPLVLVMRARREEECFLVIAYPSFKAACIVKRAKALTELHSKVLAKVIVSFMTAHVTHPRIENESESQI